MVELSDMLPVVTLAEPRSPSIGFREQICGAHNFTTAKCSGTEYKAGEIRTTGSGLSGFLNVQNQKFATVSYTKCGYTELYRMDGRGVGDIFDILTN